MNSIENWEFQYECSQSWANLDITEEASVRFCGKCCKAVYLAFTTDELSENANHGRCVAILPSIFVPMTLELEFLQESNYEGNYFTLILLPVNTLTIRQMRELRDLLKIDDNYLQVRKRFCDGREHIILENGQEPVFEIFKTRLERIGISFRFEEYEEIPSLPDPWMEKYIERYGNP